MKSVLPFHRSNETCFVAFWIEWNLANAQWKKSFSGSANYRRDVATKPKRISTWNECWNLSVKKRSESWQILNHQIFLSIIHATFWSLFCRNLVSSYEALRPRNRFWFYVFVQCAVFNQVQNTCIFRFSNFQRTKVQTHDFRTKTRVWSTSFFVSFWEKLCIFGSKQNHELGYVREVTFFKLGGSSIP